jgi:hypothetical protein
VLRLEFWVRAPAAPGGLAPVVADLPASGALEPLFHCFGLISDEELAAGLAARGGRGGGPAVADTDFVTWLRSTVYEAVLLAERHEDLKQRIREARTSIEYRHRLASLQVRRGRAGRGPGLRRAAGALRAWVGRAGATPLRRKRTACAAARGARVGRAGAMTFAPVALPRQQSRAQRAVCSPPPPSRLQVGSEFSTHPSEQQRQLEALRVLDAALEALSQDDGLDVTGLHLHVYHPDAPPVSDLGPGAGFDPSTGALGYVSDDGCLHVIADRHSLRDAVQALDLERARVLTRVTMFWLKRVRDLTPALTTLLGVQNVWCDTRTEQNSQNFVIWAGYILEQR